MKKGVYTALVTPFNDDQSVDYEGFRQLIQQQIAARIEGIVILGATGEAHSLSNSEQEKLITLACECAEGKIEIWVGTGYASTAETIEKTLQAKNLGANGAMIISPAYNKPTQEGLFRHFEAVAAATDFPILVYNAPGRAGVNIQTDTLIRMQQIPQIVAVKDASGNFGQIADVIQSKNPDFLVFSGDDSLTLPVIACGGDGIISVLSNLIPEEVSQLTHSALSGDFDKARSLHNRLLPLFNVAFVETNPTPIKVMLNQVGLPAGPVRLPLSPVTPNHYEKITTCLDEILTSHN